jgi:hypothetical protein
MMYAGMAAGHRLGLALGLAVLMLGMARWEEQRTIAWPGILWGRLSVDLGRLKSAPQGASLA